MKPSVLTYWLLGSLLLATIVSCDINKRAKEDSKRAFVLYGDGEKLKAARKFEEINEKFPESNVYGHNMFNIAYIYDELDSTKLALKWYNKILKSSLQDSLRDSTRGNKETHTNYKHYSARNIAVIYREEGDYRRMLNHANLARFKYSYYHDDPKQKKREELNVDHFRASAYERMGKLDSAVYTILPHAMTESPWSINRSEEYALKLIDKWIGREAFLKKLDAALKELVIEPTFAYFRIDGFEIQIIPWKGERSILSETRLRRTHFYRELEGKL